MSKRTLSKEEVILFIKKLGYELVDNEYTGSKQILTLLDEYGYLYNSNMSKLMHGKNNPLKFGKVNSYTIINIKLWCKYNNKQFELVSSNFEGSSVNLKWKCLIDNCGEIFEATWNNIIAGKNCGYCAGQRTGLSNCLATIYPELAKEFHIAKNKNFNIYNIHHGSNIEVWWKCLKNTKHEWKTSVSNRVTHNTGCPYCSGFYPSDDYNLLLINPALCEEWNYEKNEKNPEDYCPNSNEYVWWKCKEDHEWNVKISDRNGGTNCPYCNSSKGEMIIKDTLLEYNIPHDKEYTFNDLLGIDGGLLRYDVPVFYDDNKNILKLLIEYDGEFHFKKYYEKQNFETLQLHDKIKNKYCIEHNIPLIRIPYWEFNNIKTIIKDILIDNNMDSKFLIK